MGLPAGVVTFLFTDIEGSTRGWRERGDAMREVVDRHDAAVTAAVAPEGAVFKHTGDGLCVAFQDARAAVEAAVRAQRALVHDGPPTRIAVHTGAATPSDGDYRGLALSRTSRLLDAGHGGQVLVSEATAHVVDDLPDGVTLLDLGEYLLRDLDRPQAIFQLHAPGLPATFPALRAAPARRTNIPHGLTTFVGRREEVDEIAAAVLGDRRVVTLTGVGGVGKTRLAVEVARALEPEFVDGVWLCELASVSTPEAVDDAVAAALGVKPQQWRSTRDAVLAFARARRLLLVLDNCEHLLGPVADLVQALVQAGPAVRVLATSREGLAVRGEQIFAVGSLDQPAGDAVDEVEKADAVRLFVDRAREARAGFRLTAENAAAVAQVCRRVDGIALAIELAAARVRMLTPADIAARLDAGFRLLAGGSRSAVERHQTLRRTIDWSYDLLDDDEGRLFRRLAVFQGGFALDAVEAVCAGFGDGADALDVLTRLVDKSLVAADAVDGTSRYRQLDTIRQYAAERLEEAGEVAQARRLHAEHFLAAAEAARRLLAGPDEPAGVALVGRELDNLRAALSWCVEAEEAALAVRLVNALPWVKFPPRMEREVTGWAATVAGMAGARAVPGAGLAYACAAMGAWARGDLDAARRYAADARQVEEPAHPLTTFAVNFVAAMDGDVAEMLAGTRREFAAVDEFGEADVVGYVLAAASLTEAVFGDKAEARTAGERALEWARRSGSPSTLLFAIRALGASFELQVGPRRDPHRALALYEEAAAMEGAGPSLWALSALAAGARLRIQVGEVARGLRDLRRAVEVSARTLADAEVLFMVNDLALAMASIGETELAATLWEAVTAGSIGAFAPVSYAVEAMSKVVLPAEAAARAHALGTAMDLKQLVRFSLAEIDRVLAAT